jgi:pyruvate dehydrogenase phosphatase
VSVTGYRVTHCSFVELDENICQTPIKLLPTVTGPSTPDAPSPTPAQTFVALAAPAQAGACAISTVVDAENDDLYVALTGDCRAVAGWQDRDGKWRCDILSEDQMGENPKEVER